jgi:hypothetical protein
MSEADSEIVNPSVRSVSIADLITGRIFATALLCAAPECALAGAADVYGFSLIFYKLSVDNRIIKGERLARASLAQTALRQSANS